MVVDSADLKSRQKETIEVRITPDPASTINIFIVL